MPRPTRRSSRNRGTNEIVAPGFGTNSDINQLTRDLGGSLPRNAVLAMMQSEGRGLAGASDSNNDNGDAVAPFASPKTSSAWADFLQEEGGATAAADASTSTDSAAKSNEPPNKKLKMEEESSLSGGKVEYELSTLSTEKKGESYGSLVQCGTLDSTLIGRKNLKSTDKAVYHLAVPTVLMPLVAITKVCTSCNAAHAIAIDKSNQAYGWGRVSSILYL